MKRLTRRNSNMEAELMLLSDPEDKPATMREHIDKIQEPDRKHGEWMGTVCSCCGGSTVDYYDCDFCPKCGAIMGGKE